MVEIRFSETAKKTISEINKDNSKLGKMISKSIAEKIELLKQDPHFGEPIKSKQIPKWFLKKYNIKFLFKVRLADYWRLLYTITGTGEIEIVVVIVEFVDHEKYNQIFGFKKKQ
ncbi:MAG TPA: type II toxin-antitoxin system RelE/ParE family toxin [archaeon]|jgi:mRNA-degrading endonuclease RelE of RelBE toxin-antitoxin system|nr:type II toxin-antitoxin system RelE/ParE family toxin [archaeon]